MRRLILGVALALTVVLSTDAQPSVIFAMLYDGSEAAGWDVARPLNSQWSRTFLPTGGPQGQAIWRLNLHFAAGSSCGQFNWGWRGQELPTPSVGTRRYFEWWARYTPDTNWRARDWEACGNPANYIDKLLMINRDGCAGGSCRVIVTVEADRTTRRYYYRLQKDGGADRVDTPTYAVGDWHRVIVMVEWGNPGRYAIWVDDAPESSPTADRPNTVINVSDDPEEIRWGAFTNHGVESGGIIEWEHYGFRILTAFPSSGPSAVPPGTPTSFHVTED